MHHGCDMGDADSTKSDAKRLRIRKYPNRRYYDSTRSRHMTLEEIYAAIRDGVRERLGIELSAICLIAPRTIPRTSSGKTRRGECRDLFLRGQLDSVGEWLDLG